MPPHKTPPTEPPSDPIDRVAWYLDQAFPIPGTRYRVGWDGIIGLFPGVGEAIMLLLQAGIVIAAVARYDVPTIVAVRMVINVLIDSVVGSIPILGDVFDFFFKANTKNIALLNLVRAQRQAGVRVSKARHWFFVLIVVAILISLVVAVLLGIYLLMSYLMNFMMHWRGLLAAAGRFGLFGRAGV